MPLSLSREINTYRLLQLGFWSKVAKAGPDDCWPWQQSCGSHGYGQTWDGSTVLLAHRVVWTLTRGPIPNGMTVNHECRNRTCCNPAHLRLMTNVANAKLNGNAVKSHCKWGHPFTKENTRMNSQGHRYCRACQRIRDHGRIDD